MVKLTLNGKMMLHMARSKRGPLSMDQVGIITPTCLIEAIIILCQPLRTLRSPGTSLSDENPTVRLHPAMTAPYLWNSLPESRNSF